MKIAKLDPRVPVLIVSRIAFAKDIINKESLRERERCQDMQAGMVASARSNGDNLIHFLDGSDLLGPDFDECTVDGVHPNDLGFMRIADGLEPRIRTLLNLDRHNQPGASADGDAEATG